MINLRENVFETNSSSSHSLIFSKNPERGVKYNLELDAYHGLNDDVENGILNLTFGYFGWQACLLRDSREKLTYLLTQIANEAMIDEEDETELTWNQLLEKLYAYEKFNSVLNLVKEKCPNIKGFKFNPFLDRWYYREDGPEFDPDEPIYKFSVYPLGTIDHQSWGTAYEIEPERLIFDTGVIIVCDNDNSCFFYDYKPEKDWDQDKETGQWYVISELPPKKDPEELFTINDYYYEGESD